MVKLSDILLKSQSICRTCLSVKDVSNLFKATCGGVSVVQMLEQCTFHKAEENDGLPKNICLSCIAILYQTYSFLNMCNKSLETLYDVQVMYKTKLKSDHSYAKHPIELIDVEIDTAAESVRNTQLSVVNTVPSTQSTDGEGEAKPLKDDVISLDVTLDSGEEKPAVSPFNSSPFNPSFAKNLTQLISSYISKPRENICPICDQTKGRNVTRHIRQHMVILKLNRCYKCKVSFDTLEELREHCKQETHLNKTCDICTKTFQSLRAYVKHMEVHKALSANKQEINIKRKVRKRVYTCRFCNLSTESFKSIFSHYQDEHQYSTSCIICKKVYTSVKFVQYHMRSHNPNFFQCYQCKITFNSKDELLRHRMSDDHKNRNRCTICEKTFRSYNTLQEHAVIHTQEKRYQCDECGKTFIYVNNLNRHKRVHAGLRFQCDICKKTFTTKHIMKLHQWKLHEKIMTEASPITVKEAKIPNAHMCEICGFISRTLRAKTLHEAKHKFNHQVICSKCPKTFPGKAELNKHVDEDHEKFECTECGKKFLEKSLLKVHLKIHKWNEGEAVPNVCRLCPSVFENTSEFIEHVNKVHCIWPCEHCDRCFNFKSEVESHRAKHTGNYKFVCKYCGKGFIYSQYLKVHENMHTDTRPFKCEICHKAFRQRPHLRSHMNMHTGDKPYVCRYCQKAFAHGTTLVIHERIHTGERPYVCSVCQKGFSHSSTMKKHERGHFRLGTKIRMRDVAEYEEEQEEVGEEEVGEDEEVLYECRACRGQFTQIAELQEHECQDYEESVEDEGETEAGDVKMEGEKPDMSGEEVAYYY